MRIAIKRLQRGSDHCQSNQSMRRLEIMTPRDPRVSAKICKNMEWRSGLVGEVFGVVMEGMEIVGE